MEETQSPSETAAAAGEDDLTVEHGVRHRCEVHVEPAGDGDVRVTIDCEMCSGGSFTLASAHIQTLAVVFPAICSRLGIDLNETVQNLKILLDM